MNNKIALIITTMLICACLNTQAQDKLDKKFVGKAYFTAMAEGSILGTAITDINNSSKLSTPRYSAFFHTGFQLHKDFSKSFGIFSGLGIKNIGFINKVNDSTIKRRIYTVGLPLALKFGEMKKTFIMLGGGVDIPFNYKEKGFVERGKKDKFNEWFSNRTPSFLPYAFIGARSNKGFQVKLMYYPGNFFNTNYEVAKVPIYQNYEANLILLTFGADIGSNLGKKKKKKKKTDITIEETMPSTTQTL